MATMQVEVLGISPQKDAIDLSMLVKDATWKDVLVDLVRKNEFDPWNIDITEIVDKYITTVKALKVMDLRIPANIILAAAVLLRLKSEMLSIAEPEPLEIEGEGGFIRPDVQLDPLTLRLRPTVKRKIALVELIQALEEAMDIKERRAQERFPVKIDIPLNIQKVDIEGDMTRLHATIKKHVDKKNMTTFSYLMKEAGFDNMIFDLFVPLLHLTSRGKISLIQETFFGEIIIALSQ